MKPLLRVLALAAFAASCQSAFADDIRIWTSRTGSVLEAGFVKLSGDEVTLRSEKDRKEIRLKVTDLSLADRQYLLEVANADKSIISAGELGVPEKEAKIDRRTFHKLPDKLLLTGSTDTDGFSTMETPHFLVAWSGKHINEEVVGEIAERLWHGMAFHHMNFRRDWGDKRRLILLVSDGQAYKDLGEWYLKVLGEKNVPDEIVARTRSLWPKIGASSIYLPDDLIAKYKLHAEASLFNMTPRDTNSVPHEFKKVFTPFPTHALASDLLEQQMGGTSNIAREGDFAIKVGHAYYKEIKLAGKTETNLIDANGTGGDEISSKSGFADGSSWARTLRSEVRKGKITPDLAKIYAAKQDNLTPADLVLVYSFANYLQSTPARVSAFATLVRRVESNNTIPVPEELAKIYGFKSAKELEDDWKAYILSPAFK